MFYFHLLGYTKKSKKCTWEWRRLVNWVGRSVACAWAWAWLAGLGAPCHYSWIGKHASMRASEQHHRICRASGVTLMLFGMGLSLVWSDLVAYASIATSSRREKEKSKSKATQGEARKGKQASSVSKSACYILLADARLRW